MKILLLNVLIFFSLGVLNAQENRPELVKELLSGSLDVNTEDLNVDSPIASINKLAFDKAEKTIALTKENIKTSLQEAKNYKNCIVTVGVHTIVLITDKNKTIMSGSWGCRVPYGQGFVQKGTFNFKEDYINNIIGVPDSQRRIMFLFN